MAILTGRYGRVAFDSDAGSPTTAAEIASINAWTGDFKTEYENVACFGDENNVYLPGLKDAQGTFSGFWNSVERTLFTAADATSPGFLMLTPNEFDGSGTPLDAPFWSGLAYMDASIACTLQAPKVTGSWRAAGPFRLAPVGV